MILYLIFMAFSSLLKQSKSGRKLPPATEENFVKRAQATLKKYVDKFEEYLKQSQPSAQKITQPKPKPVQQQYKTFSQEIWEEQPEQQGFDSGDTELELVSGTPTPPPLPSKQPLGELILSESQPTRPEQSFFSFDRHHDYIQGLIMSELLRPPVSKRRNRRG